MPGRRLFQVAGIGLTLGCLRAWLEQARGSSGPPFETPDPDLGTLEAHGQVGANARPAIDHARSRHARHAERLRRLDHFDPGRLENFLADQFAGMR